MDFEYFCRHCELCSRDRELDMERELHRFRILKQTTALAKRIFEYNSILMKEANELLALETREAHVCYSLDSGLLHT